MEKYFCNFGIDILHSSIFGILEKLIRQNKDKEKEVQLREAMKELWQTEGKKKKLNFFLKKQKAS